MYNCVRLSEPQQGGKAHPRPTPKGVADVPPPPGFKKDVSPPPGFSSDVAPPPGFKSDVAPPPGFKSSNSEKLPPTKRKASSSADEPEAKALKRKFVGF